MPVGIVAQDIRKQTRRRIHGQISAIPHSLALGLDPCHQVSGSCGRSNPGQNRQAVAQQVETVAMEEFVGVKGVIRLGWHDQALVLMRVFRFAADLQTVHRLAQLTGGLVLAIEHEIRINQRIHVQPITQHPLLVAPVAGRQLGDHHHVVGALVLHPLQGIPRRPVEELRLVGRFPVQRQAKQKKWRGVAGATVGRIVRERWDMAAGRLIGSQRQQRAPQCISQLLLAGGQKAQG